MSTVIVAGGPRLGTILLTVGILGVAALVWWKGPKALDAAKKVFTEKLNPVSDKNIFYQAASRAVVPAGAPGTLGTKIYDWTHPNRPTAQTLGKKVITPADVNPAYDDAESWPEWEN